MHVTRIRNSVNTFRQYNSRLVFVRLGMQTYIILLGAILCLLNISHIYGANIRFYERSDFTGVYFKSKNGKRCTNLGRSSSRTKIGSIVTDTCVIIYGFRNCKGFWSKKVLPPNVAFPEQWMIGSFHICNNEEGGPSLNVDIINLSQSSDTGFPVRLESYRNVCSCVNVPVYVQEMGAWSIDNHANEMLAYFEHSCSDAKWKAQRIPAGHSGDSRKINSLKRVDRNTGAIYLIQSFGPDPRSMYYKTTCMKRTLVRQFIENEQTMNWLNKAYYNIPFYVNKLVNLFGFDLDLS